jgi:hypothetical protein
MHRRARAPNRWHDGCESPTQCSGRQEEHATLKAELEAREAKFGADAESMQAQLNETRDAAKASQASAEECRAERDVLSDELGGLKAEVEELTVSHDLEVERLQERLGQLQTVQDKLELSLSEKLKEHERSLTDMDAAEEQKHKGLTEQHEAASFNLKESQHMLRDAKATLKKESKAKEVAVEMTKETKAELDELIAESRQKEAELQKELTEEGTLKERLDASQAADRVQAEEAVTTLRSQLAEAKVSLKGSEKKATEYAKEYGKEFYLRKQIAEQLQEMTGGMRVFCRVRPAPPKPEKPEGAAEGAAAEDADADEPCIKVLDETTLLLEDKNDTRRPRRRFEFNQVYGPNVEQSRIFDDVRPMVGQTLQGFNVSAILYGATGSGKTYTLEGTAEEPGLLLRAINGVFEEITEVAPESMTYEAFLTCVDILDENYRDLLHPSLAEEGGGKPPLLSTIVRDATYGVSVDGATVAPVRTASHVRSLLQSAQAARAAGGADIAAQSNMVVSLTVRSANTESGESSVGKLTIVDLAGAELAPRPKKLKEGEEPEPEPAQTNKSLLALVGVIETLADANKQKRRTVDFEVSKLTDLLQDSLGGNSKTMMFVCVDPLLAHAPLSAQCLSFGQKARDVKLGAASKNKESMHTAMNKVNTTMSALTQHAGQTGGGGTNRGKPPMYPG